MTPRETFECSVRVWPELVHAIRALVNTHWRLYALDDIEVHRLDEPIEDIISYDVVSYYSPTEQVRVGYNAKPSSPAALKACKGKTPRQLCAEGMMVLPPTITISPEELIGPSTSDVLAHWRLFAEAVLDVHRDCQVRDSEHVTRFTPELRDAFARRRSLLATLEREGLRGDVKTQPARHHLGIIYGWLRELADMSIAMETTHD